MKIFHQMALPTKSKNGWEEEYLLKKKKKKLYCLEEDFERIYISVTLCFCIQVLNLRRSDVMKV